MKKLVAFLLSLSMASSMTFVSYAEDEVLSSVFFTSDYQFWANRTPGLFGDSTITSCQPVVDKLANNAYNIGYDIETLVFGGDFTQNDSLRDKNNAKDTEIFGENLQYHYGNNPNYSMSEIEQAFGKYYPEAGYIYVQGNHEPDVNTPFGAGLSPTGAYEFDDYVVYVLNDQDYVGPRPRATDISSRTDIVPGTISTIADPETVVIDVANNLRAYLERLEANDDPRPVFICSHQPLHLADGDYNGKAHYIFEVVNKMAEKLDIVYFHAHTHSGSDEIGGGISYIAEGETMKVCNDTLGADGYESVKTNFPYMNYGYLGNYKGVNEVLSATVGEIERDVITLKKYDVNGNILLTVEKIRKNIAPEENNTFILTIDSKTADVFGTDVECDVAPMIRDDRTFTPARFVAENLGAEVEWNAEKQQVTITKGNTVIKMTIGMNTIVVNGKSESIDVAPFIENDRTFTPARVIAEKLGAEVEWNADLRQVIINQ